MCGRYAFFLPPEEVLRFFRCAAPVGLAPTYNAVPSQTLPVLLLENGRRIMRMMRWGLVPSWSDGKPTFSTNNARAETVADKPAFREPFRRRRCLIPADAFYEWAEQGAKIPYCVRRSNREPFAMAGLWDRWHPAAASEVLDSFTIIVTAANGVMGRFHHRMPAILPPAWWNAWLSPDTAPADLHAMLTPCPDDVMEAYPVSSRVNSPVNNDPSLLDPVTPDAPAPAPQFRLDF